MYISYKALVGLSPVDLWPTVFGDLYQPPAKNNPSGDRFCDGRQGSVPDVD